MFALHFRTLATTESVVAGVPTIVIRVPRDEFHRDNADEKAHDELMKILQDPRPGNLLNYEGCVWNIPWEEFIDFMASSKTSEIECDPEQRNRYIQYYCGVEERSSAVRQVNEIESIK